jgi:hypothetical protein
MNRQKFPEICREEIKATVLVRDLDLKDVAAIRRCRGVYGRIITQWLS